MDPLIPVKKLFRLGLMTSPVIGVLALGTVSIVPYFFLRGFNPKYLFLFLFVVSGVVFSFWSINIGITVWLNRRGIKLSPVKRYVLSYLVIPMPILIIRLIALQYFEERTFLNEIAPDKTIFFFYIMRFCIMFSIITIIQVLQDLVLIRENKARIELENAELKVRNIEALNQQLKQQIHPHFLFNSLNTLKALINRNQEDAGNYLVKLSDFLRTNISLGQANMVSLKEEVNLSTDYLEMQKMRFGDALQFRINIPESKLHTGFVPVLALQILLENAVKHNAFTLESPLELKVAFLDDWVTVSNNLRPKQTMEGSLGFGLANLNERYHLLSGEEISIRNADGVFAVSIKVLSSVVSPKFGS